MKALVVDDNSAIRRLLAHLLGRQGISCETAETGDEALKHCERSEFAVVISDLNMPGMDGVELARRLKRRWPELVLLAFTGSSGDGLRLAAETVFDRVFEKREIAGVVAEAARNMAGRQSIGAIAKFADRFHKEHLSFQYGRMGLARSAV